MNRSIQPVSSRVASSVRGLACLVLVLGAGSALADKYSDTIGVFKAAGESGSFFGNSYGYAVVPTVGKAGIGIGGSHGSGNVYAGGNLNS